MLSRIVRSKQIRFELIAGWGNLKQYNKLWLTGLMGLLFWGPMIFGAENQLGTNIASLARTIARQFGLAEAKVAAVQGNQVYLNAGKNQFIWEGAEYEIVSEGSPVVDPVNKRKLGVLETHIAEIKIIAVRNTVSIGEITEKKETVAVGQKAIEKVKQVSIAVVGFEYLNSRDKVSPRVAQELMITELIKTGRFVVAERDRTEQVVAQLRMTSTPGSAAFTKEAGRLLGVKYIMYGFLTDLPGTLDVQCRVHNAGTGVGITAATIQSSPR
jgi:TolB-like protein